MPTKKAPPASTPIPETSQNLTDLTDRCISLRKGLVGEGLLLPQTSVPENDGEQNLSWKVSPEPFWMDKNDLRFLQDLGPRLLNFYRALNRLYFGSVHGTQPEWVARYLDQGKPDSVVALGRMNRFKQLLPGIIRPDLIPTDTGWTATELDSVPGGMGITGALASRFSNFGDQVIGGPDGMVRGFARMIHSVSGLPDPGVAVIISEEAKDYRAEMEWLGRQLNNTGLETRVIRPEEIRFSEEGLTIDEGGLPFSVDVVYRFFELFDLKNIPKSDLILYSAKKRRVGLTPPPKAFLEEKMAFALFHHPSLRPFWTESLGEETEHELRKLFPRTWILDPGEVPPQAVIPDLIHRGRTISNWRELHHATQKERRYIIKPSGFSELAWGSRGVIAGHDHSEADWINYLDEALARFPDNPSVLQTFHQGKKFTVWQESDNGGDPVRMQGRARISPYYFVDGDQAILGGVLATVCPLDKKLIHGMTEAVMIPCALKEND